MKDAHVTKATPVKFRVRLFDFFEPGLELKLPRGWEPFHAEKIDGGTVRIWAKKSKRR